MASGNLEARLNQALCSLPAEFDCRYTSQARSKLLDILFRCLTNDRSDYLADLFPNGFPESYSLEEAQGSLEQTEYTEAARGHPCGHILRPGEATYACSTCSDDPTCILCSKCFTASDHEGHAVDINISNGNGGCCDCGDEEAWKRPVICAIHTVRESIDNAQPAASQLPVDLADAARITVARALDYFCDVISCSPENLRATKTRETVEQDERRSRLDPATYTYNDLIEEKPEYNLVMWNDEKHTMDEVQDQVARACRDRRRIGLLRAEEANELGRSIISQSHDLQELLRRAKIIEEIKITVTLRSARDTFREQMCGTILEWLSDIAGCVIQGNASFLRQTICEEMLQLWRIGSEAWNARIGREGLDDNQSDEESFRAFPDSIQILLQRNQQVMVPVEDDDEDEDMDEDIDGPDLVEGEGEDDEDDFEQIDPQMIGTILAQRETDTARAQTEIVSDLDEMDTDGDNDFLDAAERMEDADETVPPPPPAGAPIMEPEPAIAVAHDELSRHPSMTLSQGDNMNFRNVPRTPGIGTHPDRRNTRADALHWRAPVDSVRKTAEASLPVWEDLRKNIRLDAMILFDLRLWKKLREKLRSLLISTMIKVPQFKRLLGLRFAGLYTTLAQLYLIADREPDHSILHLSVQILTTPSIAEEVIQRANFLTNLMAILYTFLTTRQVGFPEEVDPDATLGFDAGSVANRRLLQFFSDLRYFLSSPFIRDRVRVEKQYLMQYLDLAKLSQGICPNNRAIGEHVEYEADTWISASLLTREINKLCRQITEAYQGCGKKSGIEEYLSDAIRQSTITTLLVCSGLDDSRREQSEIKNRISFHKVGPFPGCPQQFKTVDFVVERGILSFHHPLHYTVSWLIEHGRESIQTIEVLQRTANELVERFIETAQHSRRIPLHTLYATGEDALLGIFDYPLRVCVWLAQMRANMWVRNGMSLRHQMTQYKSVTYRDLGYHRDLVMLQTAFITCDPERFLSSMIDRFGLVPWVSGTFQPTPDADELQLMDIAEDFVYLMINVLSDRDSLATSTDDPNNQLAILRKDIAHTLCFKPLSYTDLTNRLTERAQDAEQLQQVLESMTTFKAPEALNDSGLFELKPEHLQELDPYNSHFNKNQRDEAESIYKNWMAKKTNKKPEDIVLEPKLNLIKCEAYKNLCDVIHTPLFTSMLYSMLSHPILSHGGKKTITSSRAESFLQTVLHLILVATIEDQSSEEESTNPHSSFIKNALTQKVGQAGETIVTRLHGLWLSEEFSLCRSKVRHILRIFRKKWQGAFHEHDLDFEAVRLDAPSPANLDVDLEAKKRQAVERKAKIMAQMQQQQQSFMSNQGMTDWDDDEMSETEFEVADSTETRQWKFPTGVCIQCREETNDSRFYGTFAMVTDGHLLRETPPNDADFVQEVLVSPDNLDESNEGLRPFGVAGANVERIKRFASNGSESIVERRVLSRGWLKNSTLKQAISSSCGHIMHFSCFENYYESIRRRHASQVQRCQPERISQNEFVCPLCKALANVFLPVVYKATEQSYPGCLETESSFEMFTDEMLPAMRTSFESLEQGQKLSSHLIDAERTMHLQTVTTFTTNAMATLSRSIAELTEMPLDLSELPGLHALVDLSTIYRRLRNTFEIVNGSNLGMPQSVGWFLDLMANSVTAVEIGLRGRPSAGASLIDAIPAQTLSHLQVLASSLNCYAATLTMVEKTGEDAASFYPYQVLVKEMARMLFPGQQSTMSFLKMDGFNTFVAESFVLGRMQGIPVVHLLRLCLIQEMVRVAVWWLKIRTPALPSDAMLTRSSSSRTVSLSKDDYRAMGNFVFWLMSSLPATANSPLPSVNEIEPLYKALRTYALSFMRKAVILLHSAHGVDFPPSTALAGRPELDRLLGLCKLPSLTNILGDFSEFTESNALPRLVRSWISVYHTQSSTESGTLIKLMHPAPFELIGLPQYYDTLLEECQKRKCPTTGKGLTDPALCLFCGDIFCSQAWCCMKDKIRGGCNHHIEDCSAPVGAYLFIRKCNIVLLDVRKYHKNRNLTEGEESHAVRDVSSAHGSFFPAPYLTKHGETDQGLRTKHQLILNQKRYDKLVRDVWLMLNGTIWSAIARKLEGDLNAGGWETF